MTENTNTPEVKEESQDTSASEDKETQTEDASSDDQSQETEGQGEPTVGELHADKESTQKKPESVPFKRFMKEKDRRKKLEKELEELRSDKEEELEDTDDDVDDDPDVAKLADEVKEMKLKERERQLNAAFEKSFNQALENTPEYKDIVNPEVIRQMAFNPVNKDKTYKQLIEDAYGNAVGSGKETIESTTPHGGAKDSPLDMKRAERDAEYRKEVLRDPELKKQYNENLTERIQI